ncbi:Superfamily I DNA and RNA helicases [Enterobacter cancerogenus]|uniref:Superfamily I DNA and RNA helicases n=1 Tax=Enterobacter cancerogenus TaxID=69218 RepID=A0A484X8W1_9ENTR|nr:Superfamily I DNA and RNA helicases [Enterobacter cancerogenus]
MELKATSMGKRLAQHPYDKVVLLNAGVKVSGERHEYLIPFNQLLAIHCKRGLVWGELEFVLPDDKVVRLHGTEWAQTQRFHHHLSTLWQQWSEDMSVIAAQVLQQVLDDIAHSNEQQKWLTRQQTAGLQQKIKHALTALPLPASRLDEFENCREAWRTCQAWLNDIDKRRLAHNQAWTDAMLTQYADFFSTVESSPLNPAQARAVVNGESSLLVLAGAGSGKTSVLVARAGWLLTTGEAVADQILLLAFGRKAAQEMDERIQSRLHTQDIAARTFHSLALHIIQQGSKKVPVVSKLENDAQARQALFVKTWQQQCSEKKAQAKGWRQWLEDELNWEVPEGNFWQDDKLARRLGSRLDRWVSLMRMHGGSQAEMIENAPEAIRAVFSKRIKLMARC